MVYPTRYFFTNRSPDIIVERCDSSIAVFVTTSLGAQLTCTSFHWTNTLFHVPTNEDIGNLHQQSTDCSFPIRLAVAEILS
jgi:hypothetical protein